MVKTCYREFYVEVAERQVSPSNSCCLRVINVPSSGPTSLPFWNYNHRRGQNQPKDMKRSAKHYFNPPSVFYRQSIWRNIRSSSFQKIHYFGATQIFTKHFAKYPWYFICNVPSFRIVDPASLVRKSHQHRFPYHWQAGARLSEELHCRGFYTQG